jgi:hypothetical protein
VAVIDLSAVGESHPRTFAALGLLNQYVRTVTLGALAVTFSFGLTFALSGR